MATTGKKTRRSGSGRGARYGIAPRAERRWLLGGTALTAGVVAGLGALIALPTPARADCGPGTNFITCMDMPGGETDPQTLTASDEWVVHVGVVDLNDDETPGTITIGGGTPADAALKVNANNNSGAIFVTQNSSIGIGDDKVNTFNTRHGILVVPGGNTADQLIEFVIDGSVSSSDFNGDGIQISGSGNATASATSNAFHVDIDVGSKGSVSGADDGVQLTGLRGELTITNAGVISGGATADLPFERQGIIVTQNLNLSDRVAGNITITNESTGDILGGNSSAIHIATEGNVDITNYGEIIGKGEDRGGIFLNVGGDVVIYNDGSIEGGGHGIDVTGAASSSITNTSYNSIVGVDSGINETDIGKFVLDNAGGLVAGLGDEGVNIEDVTGADGVWINNAGRAGTGDEDEVLGGGVIIGNWDGIQIDDVWRGDVVINNGGFTEGEQNYSGGLIYGAGGSGIQISEADGNVTIENNNTYNWVGSGVALGGLNDKVDGFFPGGKLAGTGFTTGIWGDDHGIEIDGSGDDDGSVGIQNLGGLIVGINDHAIEVSHVDGRFIDGEEEDYYLSFVLDNGGSDENPDQGGLVWGGENAVDLWDMDGDVIISNGNGTIFGREDGIEIGDVWRGDVSVTNGKGGLIQGLWGDAIDIREVDSAGEFGEFGGSVYVGNSGWILAGDRAIRVRDAETVGIWNNGLIIGDGSSDQPVIAVSGTDTDKVGTESEAATEITNAAGGIIASRNLPHFDYSSWSSPDATEVPASSLDATALWNDVTNFQSFVTSDSELDMDAMDDYAEASSDRIVQTSDGAALLTNEAGGLMVGQVRMSGSNDEDKVGNGVVNNGAWFVTGYNSVNGDADNDAIQNNGWIQSAFDYTDDEWTGFRTDAFNNAGVLSLADGGAGDRMRIWGNYDGTAGSLAVDVDFGNAESDRLSIEGDITGQTGIIVRRGYETGIGYLGDEIDVVSYSDNTEEPADDAFYISNTSTGYVQIAGGDYIQDGLLAWYLQHDADWDDYELVNDWGPGAQNAPAIISGAQQIFYDTLGTVEDHIYGGQFGQSGGGGADVVEMAPAVEARTADGGIWGKATGRWTDRDRDLTLGGIAVDGASDQSTYALLAGADFVPGDGFFRLGVFGGYISSDLDFALGDAGVDYSGGTLGAYGAYNNGALYADVTVKGDFLSADYTFGGIDVDADVFNYGVYGNLGYRMARGHAFIEPLVSAAFARTTVDDVATGGHSLTFDDGNSARLGIGARVGGQFATGGMITEVAVLGRIWNEFSDDNTVVVSDGLNTATFTDDVSGVFGEVNGTLTFKRADSGWSGFVSGTGQFGNDYQSYGASAGLRVNF